MIACDTALANLQERLITGGGAETVLARGRERESVTTVTEGGEVVGRGGFGRATLMTPLVDFSVASTDCRGVTLLHGRR
jgi:hypothetical protein